ncbi:MAG: DEAD/DEAH box helicase, partial [Deltaproteobacteria bacterium]|nr:DEAD/DEAH box helicase [Deltaproteobacteria bacterium]
LVIGQLQGLELPGPAWERDVLPARIADYDPDDLEHLCLAGEVAWGRLAAAAADADGEAKRRQAPTRSAPLGLALRADLPDLLAPLDDPGPLLACCAVETQAVFAHLATRGASFLPDIARAIGQPPAVVEEALWQLVAAGLVTGDGIAGLRALLWPRDAHPPRVAHLRAVRGGAARRLMPAGRWSLLRAADTATGSAPRATDDEQAERTARRLLRRWGVVFRELLARERHLPRWRALLAALRRLEARGELRGGRFVDGFAGEQFALPEAVDALRSLRRRARGGETVVVSAADPLNLVGVLNDEPRIASSEPVALRYRDGVFIGIDAPDDGFVVGR